MSGSAARGGWLGDEARSRDGDRFLREQPRQIVGGRREVDAALAARGDVLQERRVRSRVSLPSPMTLTVMPSGVERLEQPLVVARLLGVRRVGEQHDVPRALLGLLHHRARR